VDVSGKSVRNPLSALPDPDHRLALPLPPGSAHTSSRFELSPCSHGSPSETIPHRARVVALVDLARNGLARTRRARARLSRLRLPHHHQHRRVGRQSAPCLLCPRSWQLARSRAAKAALCSLADLLITSTTSFFIGRDPSKNDYVIPSTVVSAKHLRVFAVRPSSHLSSAVLQLTFGLIRGYMLLRSLADPK
jgi:hypothetical protein